MPLPSGLIKLPVNHNLTGFKNPLGLNKSTKIIVDKIFDAKMSDILRLISNILLKNNGKFKT